MLETLRKQVYAANMELPARGLVTYTWGNVSGIDRATGLVVIKPSGVPYEELTPANLVVVNLENGATVEGNLRPSSDVDTHLELYRQLPKLGGVVHTHSHLGHDFCPGRSGFRPWEPPTPIIFTAPSPAPVP
jgi:L-ribulose-5-phosphate 4-epimerase